LSAWYSNQTIKSMKTHKLFISIITLSILSITVAFSQDLSEYNHQEAEMTIDTFKTADSELEQLFETAYGYAVIPSVAKGAVGIGGAAGKGIVYEGGEPVGGVQMTQVSIGLQLGGREFSEVIFFENEEAFKKFTDDDFQLSADATAVALKEGATTNERYTNGVLIFTKPKGGLMFDASVGGQKFEFSPVEEID
jgi:lipid-binding SYLF domain-containing protein